jgi:hypothetical protein
MCLDKSTPTTNPLAVDKTRPKVMQLKMHEFVQDIPTNWAIRFRWYTDTRKPGAPEGPRPHTSLAISACLAGVNALPYQEQQRILMNGMRLVMAKENSLPNREKMRLCRSSEYRPAGINHAS